MNILLHSYVYARIQYQLMYWSTIRVEKDMEVDTTCKWQKPIVCGPSTLLRVYLVKIAYNFLQQEKSAWN